MLFRPLAILLLFTITAKAQRQKIDSLNRLLTGTKIDTQHVALIFALAEQFQDLSSDSTIRYLKVAKQISGQRYLNGKLSVSESAFYVKMIVETELTLGYEYQKNGEFARALTHFESGGRIARLSDNKTGVGLSLNNIAYVYQSQGDIKKSISYYEQSLKFSEQANDSAVMPEALNNLAIVYGDQGEYDKAMEYHKRALAIAQRTGNRNQVGMNLINMGFVCRQRGENKKGYEYYLKAEEIYKEEKNNYMLAHVYDHLGAIDYEEGRVDEAIRRLKESGGMYKAVKDANSYALILHNIASILHKADRRREAYPIARESLSESRRSGAPDRIQTSAFLLYRINSLLGNYKEALEMYELATRMRDSISNEENKKAGLKSQLKYEYEKKAAADSVRVAEEKKVTAAQLKQEQTQRYALYGGLSLVGIFALFMVNRFRVTNKQKKVIEAQKQIVEEQKHLVEEKQKEVLDSIHYAKRIQTALMPHEKYIARNLKKLQAR